MHHVRGLLIHGGAKKHEIQEYTTLAFKGSYEDLLALTKRWVTVEEV